MMMDKNACKKQGSRDVDTSSHYCLFVLLVPSHIQTLLSLPQVAMNDPEELQATDLTSFSCPSRVALHSNSKINKIFHINLLIPTKSIIG